MPLLSRCLGAVIAMLGLCPALVAAADVHVSATGSDANAGGQATPLASVCAGIARCQDGGTVRVAEGVYSFPDTCAIGRRRVSVLGGYTSDFSARDPFVNASRIGAGAAVRALMRAGGGVDELVLDGLVFDGGESSAYGAGICADCLSAPYDARLHEPLLALDQAGRVTLRNVVFVNAPGGAVGGSVRSSLLIDGAAIVNARPFAISVSGACGYASPLCVEAAIRHLTAVWIWRESYDADALGGSAIVIGSGVSARVERSVVAYSDRVAIEVEQRPSEVALQTLVVFDNRLGDVGAMSGSGLVAAPIGLAGEAHGLSGGGPYGRMERLALPWDVDYLHRFLARARTPFYGVRLSPSRAFLLSPAQDAGLRSPQGSRYTYAMAVSGRTSVEPMARAAPAIEAAKPPDAGKDKKRRPQKKPRKGRGK